MSLLTDYIGVSYDFYKKYLENNKDFDTKLKKRTKMIISKYFVDKSLSETDVIKNYFVEIFCWSVIPFDLLSIIIKEITKLNLEGVIDPCCGNGFHTYLFESFSDLKSYTVDIQDEENSWNKINEIDGRDFLKNLDVSVHKKNVLILSWIDYESLTIELLNLYKGNMVISIGNYDKLSPNYISLLNKKFNLTHRFVLEMPWGLTEKIEIYKAINKTK